MTLRTRSRAWQWIVWVAAAALSAAGYVIVFRLTGGKGGLGNLFGADQLRVLLPLGVIFAFVAYETRWDGVVRDPDDDAYDDLAMTSGTGVADTVPVGSALPPKGIEIPADVTDKAPPTETDDENGYGPAPGEAEYATARAMPHQEIPDYIYDAEYLEMLGKAAELGFPRAYAKLGDYAMRRNTLVEAYYWLWMARRKGIPHLDPVLRGIRITWGMAGRPDESSNEHPVFTEEMGSIGRALLGIDSNFNTDAAIAFLKQHRPDLLDS